MLLVCRNRVADYQRWRAVFESHAEAYGAAGLLLKDHWVNANDPNEVFFLFEVDDREKAEAFMATPQAAEGAEEAGVLAGDYWFALQANVY
jgi:hypothetical protein